MLHANRDRRKGECARSTSLPVSFGQFSDPLYHVLQGKISQLCALPLVVPRQRLDILVWHAGPPRLDLGQSGHGQRLARLENEAFDIPAFARGQGVDQGVVQRGVAEAVGNLRVGRVDGVADGYPTEACMLERGEAMYRSTYSSCRYILLQTLLNAFTFLASGIYT